MSTTNIKNQCYAKLLSLSKDCGILCTFNFNNYTKIHPKCKLLVQQFIHKYSAATANNKLFIPHSICQIISIFYSSFNIKNIYEECRHINTDKLFHNASKWVKGCYSNHIPTKSISIYNIEKLLYISQSLKQPIITQTILDTNILPYIITFTKNIDFDDDLAFKCIKILNYMTLKQTNKHRNLLIQNNIIQLLCAIPAGSLSFMIKKQSFEILIRFCDNKNINKIPSFTRTFFIPYFTLIWKINNYSYIKSLPSSELLFEDSIYCNTKRKYIWYLVYASELLSIMTKSTDFEINNDTYMKQFINSWKLINKYNDNIFLWIQHVLRVLKLFDYNIYECPMTKIYKYISKSLISLFYINQAVDYHNNLCKKMHKFNIIKELQHNFLLIKNNNIMQMFDIILSKSLNTKKINNELNPTYYKGLQQIKCVIIGDIALDKSSLILQYTTNTFSTMYNSYIPTVVENTYHTQVIDGIHCGLGIWDTSGQEEYDKLRPLSYHQADVFIILFSTICKKSFENVKYKWIPEINENAPNVVYIVVGTNADLRDDNDENRVISREQGIKLAKQCGAVRYLECDVLIKREVENVFHEAVRDALRKRGSKKFQKIKGFFSKYF